MSTVVLSSRPVSVLNDPKRSVHGNEYTFIVQEPGCDDDGKSTDSGVRGDIKISGRTPSADPGQSEVSDFSWEPVVKQTDRDPLQNEDIENKTETATKESRNIIDKSFWLKIVVLFSILDVLLAATILVVEFGLPCQESSVPSQSQHCLPCIDVYLTEDDKTDNIYNLNITGNFCCSDNETLLIQKYVIKRYRSDVAKASADRDFPKRTAIHLYLDLQDEISKNEGSDQTLKWTTDNSVVSVNLSLSVDRTRIQIGRTGLYYISPRVVFDDKKDDTVEGGLGPMSLRLYREVNGVRHLLQERKETHCAHSATKCAKPSSTQGVFKMEKGDSVLVTVTKPCGLVAEHNLNHFDMYLI